MRKYIYILLIIVFTNSTYSQTNLVPNFSFEQYSSCPTSGDQADFATGWSKYSNSASTPDYYNACSSSNTVGIPQSFFLYQQDNRSCGAYIGLVTWTTNLNEREHIGIQFSQPLVIGQKYYLSFYTVMGGTDDGTYYYESPANNIGMRLSTLAYNSSNPVPIDNFSHLHSTAIINDTANWTRVSGSIIADSAYNYLMLGNFYDQTNTDTTTLNCASCLNVVSYNLVDDICVSTDSLLCNGGVEALPCIIFIEENNFENQISIFPNPGSGYINITNGGYSIPLNITIYNNLGQILFNEQNINFYNKQIDISHYNNGLLLIKIESSNQSIIYKLLKQ